MIVNERFIITFDKQKEADAIEYFERQNEEITEKWIEETHNLAVSFRKENTYYVEYDGIEGEKND